MAAVTYPSAEAIAGLAREAQQQQLQSLDSLDTKAATLLGLAGVVLGLIFTSPLATKHWSASLTVGAGTIAAAIVVLGVAILPRNYKFNPNITTLATPNYMQQNADQTYYITTASILEALLFNADRIKLKARLLRIGTALAVIGLVVVTIGLIRAT